MNARKKKWLLILGLFIGLIALSAWYIFLKPARNIRNESYLSITADSLFLAYQKNEKNADSNYLDKALLVSGNISEIKTNQQGQQVIVLSTSDPIFGIACTLSEPGRKEQVGKGVQVNIKGFCAGFTSDVVLRDCIITNE